jgi:predicted GH43/DUF377 family glycosyl hydrolase
MWRKLGLVYVPNGEQPWAVSHALVPTVWMPAEDRIRVFAAFLDQQKVGRVGYVDVDARDPRRILQVSAQPVLDTGRPGTFDDSGVLPSFILDHKGKLYLYYVGWQKGVQVRYHILGGLAVSEDGGEHFSRYSEVPILDRGDGELFVRSSPFVLHDDDKWKMWYIAGDQWIDFKGKQVPTYNLRYLESSDPFNWGKQGTVCLDLGESDEFGFTRPFVIKEDGLFKMWYSIRSFSKEYRLGYAESQDGLQWVRKDNEVGISPSVTSWDSEMMLCPCIQETRFGTYMFYNGNNYGETGFGVAVQQ